MKIKKEICEKCGALTEVTNMGICKKCWDELDLEVEETEKFMKENPVKIPKSLENAGEVFCRILMKRENKLKEENEKYKQWINDLQSGMYINCVYCGHRYGPEKNTPVSMADILKEHIKQCSKHPMKEAVEVCKMLTEIDWCIGYELMKYQQEELNNARTKAFKVLALFK